MKKLPLPIVLLAYFCLLALAACGGGDSAGQSTAIPPQAQAVSQADQLRRLNNILGAGDLPLARALALQLLADPTWPAADLPALATAIYSPGPRRLLSGQGPNVYAMQFSADQQHLLAITCERRQVVNGDEQCAEGGLLVWETQGGQLLHRWTQADSSLTSLALLPDGRQALTAHCAEYEVGTFRDSQRRCIAAEVSLWDWASGQRAPSLVNFKDVVLRLAVHPDGQHAAALGCGAFQEMPDRRNNRLCVSWSILIWNLGSGQVVFQGDSPNFVFRMAFDPNDPSRFYALTDNPDGGSILFQWAWASGQQVQITLPPSAEPMLAEDTPNRLQDIVFSGDYGAVALVFLNAEGLWYGIPGQTADYLPTGDLGPRDYLNEAAIFPVAGSSLPESLLVWAQTSTDQLVLWDVVAGRTRAILAKNIPSYPLLFISPDGRQGVSYQNGELMLWQFSPSPAPTGAAATAQALLEYACALPYRYELSPEDLSLAGLAQDRRPCGS